MTTAPHAPGAGQDMPTSDEASTVAAVRGFMKEHKKNNNDDSAVADAEGKEFQRIRALLAPRGHCAYRANPADGRGYVVLRGAWLFECADLAALRQLVERFGGGR